MRDDLAGARHPTGWTRFFHDTIGLPARVPAISPWVDSALLALLALTFGLAGGAASYHPDQVLSVGLSAVANAGNPEFFSYPGLVLYLQAGVFLLVFGALSLVGSVSGDVWEVHASGLLLRGPVELSVHAPGHLLTVLFSWAALEAVYRITRELLGSRVLGLLAGAILGTAPLWVANAHYLTVDLPAAALVALTLFTCVRAGRSGWSRRRTLVVGTLFGLAVSAKYPSVLVFPSIAAFVVLASGASLRSLAQRVAAIAAVGAAVFLVTNPYVVLDFPSFLDGVLREVRHARVGHFGYTASNGWLFHLSRSFGDGYGWPALILAMVGFVALARDTDVPRSSRVALLTYPVIHVLVVGRSDLAFARYMLPAFPVLAVLTVVGLTRLLGFFRGAARQSSRAQRPWATAVALALVTALLVPNVRTSLRHDVLLARTDTRTVLRAVMRALPPPGEEPEGSRVAVGSFVWTSVPGDIGWTRQNTIPGADIAVLDSFSHDPYLYHASVKPRGMQPPAWPDSIAFDLLPPRPALVISPYEGQRSSVPFSPESAYSPFLPDLPFRTHPGPYIEIYLLDGELPPPAYEVCDRYDVRCWTPEEPGYFVTRGAGPADPSRRDGG